MKDMTLWTCTNNYIAKAARRGQDIVVMAAGLIPHVQFIREPSYDKNGGFPHHLEE